MQVLSWYEEGCGALRLYARMWVTVNTKVGCRVQGRKYIMCLGQVCIEDPCPLGVPEMLTGAHMMVSIGIKRDFYRVWLAVSMRLDRLYDGLCFHLSRRA